MIVSFSTWLFSQESIFAIGVFLMVTYLVVLGLLELRALWRRKLDELFNRDEEDQP